MSAAPKWTRTRKAWSARIKDSRYSVAPKSDDPFGRVGVWKDGRYVGSAGTVAAGKRLAEEIAATFKPKEPKP